MTGGWRKNRKEGTSQPTNQPSNVEMNERTNEVRKVVGEAMYKEGDLKLP